MSQNGPGASDARQAAELNARLMTQYSSTGLPIFRQGLDAVHGALANVGREGYVNDAFAGAGTSAYEAATAQTGAAKAALLSRNPRASLSSIASIYAGGAKSLQSEQAGIALSKASSTISHRNQLVDMLKGGGFQATDLSVGFGGLTNRALSTAIQGGNSLYEGVLAGTAVGAPLLMSAFGSGRSPLASPSQQSQAFSLGQLAGAGLYG